MTNQWRVLPRLADEILDACEYPARVVWVSSSGVDPPRFGADATTLPEVDNAGTVTTYVEAWHERDEATRRRLLEQTWAEDGVYADPEDTIVGREALIDAIGDFHERRPGVRIEIRSPIDAFGRHFRFVWATIDGDGDVLREGIDVGLFDEDGRIVSIVGFFGITP
jgi:hypothetical protein